MTDTVIVGSGPYGLSIAAHLRKHGLPFRIFGRPMDSWAAHMPKGMLLKSEGFASNLYDPAGDFTLGKFCAQQRIDYADLGTPVSLQTFTSYGLAFRDKLVPELEERLVTGVHRSATGYRIELDNGEVLAAARVILAIGITHFAHLPQALAHLPQEFVTHSFAHSSLQHFRGRKIAVIGSGASASDLAAFLHESGADVHILARDKALKFHTKMPARSLWQRLRVPNSGIGSGLKSRFYADAPNVFHYLPEETRLRIVRTHLGPSGGWFMRDRVIGNVPVILGSTILKAQLADGGVSLGLRSNDGRATQFWAEHVIAATGYQVDVERLRFLDPEIRRSIKRVASSPVLSSNFESSLPGLYFVGLASANGFGPVMRFAFGARYAAQRLTRVISKSSSKKRAMVAARDIRHSQQGRPLATTVREESPSVSAD